MRERRLRIFTGHNINTNVNSSDHKSRNLSLEKLFFRRRENCSFRGGIQTTRLDEKGLIRVT